MSQVRPLGYDSCVGKVAVEATYSTSKTKNNAGLVE